MNPRHRRLLIPGLLVALVVVAAISSLVQKAGAATSGGVVAVIDDERITEASGLAISRAHDDLVYVINDSGDDAQVFAVRLSTGAVVGTTRLDGVQAKDTEALSIGPDGRLWVADTGDNLRTRDDVALYVFDEPGPGDHRVRPTRYAVDYAEGPRDVESLMVDPRDGRVYLTTKGLLSGSFHRLPERLSTSRPNRAEEIADTAPGMVTDATFTPDGEHVLVRTYTNVREFSSADWEQRRTFDVPSMKQGESIAAEEESFLLGTEGRPSPIVRVARPVVVPAEVTSQQATAAGLAVAVLLALRRP